MEFKGTSEKWFIERWGNVVSENDEVAYMPSLNNQEINNANSLLISKSPELLDMLKKMLAMYTLTDKPSVRLITEAKQLIKEATEL